MPPRTGNGSRFQLRLRRPSGWHRNLTSAVQRLFQRDDYQSLGNLTQSGNFSGNFLRVIPERRYATNSCDELSIPSSATIIQRPTSIGWAFSFPGSATPRGVRRRSACATLWRSGVLRSPGSTLFCSQFYQNLRQLLRGSTRRRPFVARTCACVTAIGCPSRLDHQGIRPTRGSAPPRKPSNTALRAAAWSRGLGRLVTARRASSP